jgi:hypothetical protein
MIELSVKQAQAWELLDDPTIVEVFAGGGAGGGKSYLGCLRQIYRRTTFPGTRGFIGREDFTALRDSTLKTYFTILHELGYRSVEHYTYNGQEHVIYWKNGSAELPGSEQHFRYMRHMPSDPDYNRFGSTEYTDAFIDEAPEVDARACQVLLSRLRYLHGRYGITPELLYTGNPGESWIKDQFVQDADGRMIDLPKHRGRVLFTIRDNPDEQLKQQYINTLMHLDSYDRARLLEGDWSARPKAERPFAFAFDRKKHVRPFILDRKLPVIIGIDFNVDPFCALICQEQGNTFGVAHEIDIKGGTVNEMVQRILAIAPDAFMHSYTGDHTGAARRIQMNSTASIWDDFMQAIKARENQLKLPANPTHKESREQMAYVHHHHPAFVIDPSCTGLIYDLETVEVDAELRIVKSDRSKLNQRADKLDVLRYVINTYLYRWINTHRKTNALFQQRQGTQAATVRGR